MANPNITTDKVRFFMMDRCAKENFLLDKQEFTNEDIASAFDLAVSKFNTCDPILRTQIFTVDNFPYEYEACLGIAAILLRAKATNMVRNRLEGNGQIVDDKQNAALYLKLGNDLDLEFTQRSRMIKGHVNINGPGSFGRVPGMMERPNGWSY